MLETTDYIMIALIVAGIKTLYLIIEGSIEWYLNRKEENKPTLPIKPDGLLYSVMVTFNDGSFRECIFTDKNLALDTLSYYNEKPHVCRTDLTTDTAGKQQHDMAV